MNKVEKRNIQKKTEFSEIDFGGFEGFSKMISISTINNQSSIWFP